MVSFIFQSRTGLLQNSSRRARARKTPSNPGPAGATASGLAMVALTTGAFRCSVESHPPRTTPPTSAETIRAAAVPVSGAEPPQVGAKLAQFISQSPRPQEKELQIRFGVRLTLRDTRLWVKAQTGLRFILSQDDRDRVRVKAAQIVHTEIIAGRTPPWEKSPYESIKQEPPRALKASSAPHARTSP